ncbi:hypothetical protein QBC34DRAFT_379797 [Podospora aff. communis PSN243]|uniref:Uncharacterized protein n=1 Tax=Podospora aff. communis PSN243 TaxID=3040156 RepID=A0AAV9GQJ4_9PEZI|nr:hypothetical protein QBC34DRAFT_379797 [Podospora aff. communis PSN243]
MADSTLGLYAVTAPTLPSLSSGPDLITPDESAPTRPYTHFPSTLAALVNLGLNPLTTIKTWKLCAVDQNPISPPASASSSTSDLSHKPAQTTTAPSSPSSSSCPALFFISVHFGLTTGSPLGIDRPSVYLHNGPSKRDPVLAAAGDYTSRSDIRVRQNLQGSDSALGASFGPAHDPRSFVLIPAADGSGSYERIIITGAVIDGVVKFRFEVDIDGDFEGRKSRKGVFEWRKEKRGEGFGGGGFRLVWAGVGVERVAEAENEFGETVALLRWSKGVKVLSQLYSVELQRSGCKGILGTRWESAAIVTAAWLYALRVSGRIGKVSHSVSEVSSN